MVSIPEQEAAIVEFIGTRGITSRADIINYMTGFADVAPPTVHNRLKELRRRGLITVEQRGRKHIYRVVTDAETVPPSDDDRVSELVWNVLDDRDPDSAANKFQVTLADLMCEAVRRAVTATEAWHGELGQRIIDINAEELAKKDAEIASLKRRLAAVKQTVEGV